MLLETEGFCFTLTQSPYFFANLSGKVIMSSGKIRALDYNFSVRAVQVYRRFLSKASFVK